MKIKNTNNVFVVVVMFYTAKQMFDYDSLNQILLFTSKLRIVRIFSFSLTLTDKIMFPRTLAANIPRTFREHSANTCREHSANNLKCSRLVCKLGLREPFCREYSANTLPRTLRKHFAAYTPQTL